MFIDTASITVSSGKGGNGIVSFRREKFVPKGGPDGGDGGRGGNVVFLADRHLTTLLDFRYKRIYKAGDGRPGMGARKTGKNGNDIEILLPPGTILKDATSGKTITDLRAAGDRFVAARGGKGGRGNVWFKSSTNQAPRKCEQGKPGEELIIQLELKMIADVALVGFPNAGKSTLISRISAAKPKIADYPFTTLVPTLGIVRYEDYRSFVVADIPGLIEGAHTGKGLGTRFLRHIERTRVLVFLLDCSGDPVEQQYATLVGELEKHNSELARKPRIVTISKIDVADPKTLRSLKKTSFGPDVTHLLFSSVTGDGLKKLLDTIWKTLSAETG
jgi:GTP-binding protein